MDKEAIQRIIDGKTILGIELGSTRIKAVLIDQNHEPLAAGTHDWENKLIDGIWTYSLEDVWKGLQDAYANLSADVKNKYGTDLVKIGAIGISAMMHGYLVFDKDGNQLVPFRTWRNTITEKSAEILSKELEFNIPQRWSIAHVYQAVLNDEKHIKDIALLTTLSSYVHLKLTGQNVIGLGEASGMFPIDSTINNFNENMVRKFNSLIEEKNLHWELEDILPKVLNAGDEAGKLTEAGARLLDKSGILQAGVPLCPPEGDAGTGMVATNSVAEQKGNISAGTSVFAMIVLEKDLSKVYPEIDMVTTPSGKPVAMVHSNSCTSDLDAWVKLFGEAIEAMGVKVDKTELYKTLYNKALEGESGGGGLLSYNYYSGEPITETGGGRPLFVRTPDSDFSLADFMRTLLFSTMGTIRLGMDILTEKENVKLKQLLGHGGLFKTKTVGQKLMAGALNVPVAVMESAAEGGAWGIALLAAYMLQKEENETLENYLDKKVFAGMESSVIQPDPEDIKGFNAFMERYVAGLAIEKAAIENLK